MPNALGRLVRRIFGNEGNAAAHAPPDPRPANWADVVRAGPRRLATKPLDSDQVAAPDSNESSPVRPVAPSRPAPSGEFLATIGIALDYELSRLRGLLCEIERRKLEGAARDGLPNRSY